MLEKLLVAVLVATAALVSVRALLPFGWRVALAKRLARHVPDRCVIWFAGQTACEACGGRTPRVVPQRTR